MQLKMCRIILIVCLMLISSTPLPTLAQLKNQNPPILLTHDEQSLLGTYIRKCETELVQANYYEDQYKSCSDQLDNQSSLGTKILSYLLVLTLGYAIGVKN